MLKPFRVQCLETCCRFTTNFFYFLFYDVEFRFSFEVVGISVGKLFDNYSYLIIHALYSVSKVVFCKIKWPLRFYDVLFMAAYTIQ